MDTVTLSEALSHVLAGYAGRALNGYSYLTSSADAQVFAVVSVARLREQRIVDAGLIARVVNDSIVIEQDINDKPLVGALPCDFSRRLNPNVAVLPRRSDGRRRREAL